MAKYGAHIYVDPKETIIIPFDDMVPFFRLELGKAEAEMLELDISTKVDETTINKDQVLGSNAIVSASNQICKVIVVFIIGKRVGSNSKKSKFTGTQEMVRALGQQNPLTNLSRKIGNIEFDSRIRELGRSVWILVLALVG